MSIIRTGPLDHNNPFTEKKSFAIFKTAHSQTPVTRASSRRPASSSINQSIFKQRTTQTISFNLDSTINPRPAFLSRREPSSSPRDIFAAALYSYAPASPPQTPAAPLSSQQSSLDNDLYEAHDPLSRHPRRQQQYVQQQHLRQPPLQQQQQQQTRPSTSGSGTSTHTLRRTPKFDERANPRPRAFSASALDRPAFANVETIARVQPQTNPPPIPVIEAQSEQTENTTTTAATNPPTQETWWPRRTTRISKRTADAILYTLEEAIRTPFPFTSDEVEENASMADLGSGAVGQSRRQANRNPADENIPVSTTPEPARLRGPREILKERERKEALRRLQQEEQNRRSGGRRYDQAAGVGDNEGEGTDKRRKPQQVNPAQARNTTGAGDNTGTRGIVQANEPQSQPVAATRNEARATTRDNGAQATSQSAPQPSARAERTSTRQNPQVSQQPRTSSGPEGNARQQNSGTNQPRNSSTSFPHAFERWETLSSHWEGLTSFWIKRLQGNSEELNGQHINQQLARQVTDLSAAGANLFHAVVELQRLRASSERKFQRWFFEVRDDQEKTAEKIARLEADLATARQTQTPQPVATPAPSPEEIRRQAEEMAAAEIEKIKRQCALEVKEKNRELDISREEARRGWEEIGRLEQRDRDRTFSLRRGEPTILGGVQVVPFQPNEGSRHARGQSGGLSQHPPENTTSSYTPDHDARWTEPESDPFVEGSNQGRTEAFGAATTSRQNESPTATRTRGASASPARPRTAGQPFPSSSIHAANPATSSVPSAAFYKQSGAEASLHQTPTRGPVQADRSYATSEHSEDEDYEVDTGRNMRDMQSNPTGQRTNPSSEISDEYDVLEQMEQNQLFSTGLPGNYGPAQYTTSNGGSYQAPDYSGAGYGGRDWEGVPQHHHPSRLSNILEEDERSRTSETSRRVPH